MRGFEEIIEKLILSRYIATEEEDWYDNNNEPNTEVEIVNFGDKKVRDVVCSDTDGLYGRIASVWQQSLESANMLFQIQ